MSILGLVPARGGSKGIRRKNLVDVAGKPLLSWTIDAALRSGIVDRLVVSTEDDEIAEVALESGAEVPFRRSADLAGDEAAAVDVAIEALDHLGDPSWLLLLQPTSPLRTADDIVAAVARCTPEVDRIVSVRPVRDHPGWLVHVEPDGAVRRWTSRAGVRRQDEPQLFVPNGAIYLVRPDVLRRDRTWIGDRTCAYIMPEERSIDVDSPWDLRLVSLLLSERP